MIKLIAIDLDGTLLTDDHEIPKENIEAIHAAVKKGVKIVISTGRPMSGVRPIFEKLQLSEKEFVIINNGSSTYETSRWQLIDYFNLTDKDVTSLYQLVEKETDIQLTIFDEDGYYFVLAENPLPVVTFDANIVFVKPTPITLEQLLERHKINFQGMYLAEPAVLDNFQKKYEAELSSRYSTVRSQNYIFETLPKGATKASALMKLIEELNISKEEVMAIGDGNNDIEMLEMAGISVAMGNAGEAVKKAAKYQTDSNNNNGLAKAINKYILK
ncbi:Cof-type HAD-IIB family hydrolase [Streptococcus pacificus]|uniref:HAD family phosphatase n=1 Tax=Streptococcus pacificus TaxID=2740577 RepID=A0ABS0ZGK6_9STRE|nr:Cof-type HAD-IIB family hydrolase [Streptococcus pacificus]MBJ8325127.1 HAD family phosphatase [Streptococcus pacificus]